MSSSYSALNQKYNTLLALVLENTTAVGSLTLNDVLEYGYSDKQKHTCLNTSCGRDVNQRYMLHRYATTGMTTIIYTDETMDESKGVRYCTQTELEKLHNIPLGYTRNLNKAQAGNLIGDGWAVGIVEHIFSFMRSV
jgi:hypothetical protein